jgi:hypothetical protein
MKRAPRGRRCGRIGLREWRRLVVGLILRAAMAPPTLCGRGKWQRPGGRGQGGQGEGLRLHAAGRRASSCRWQNSRGTPGGLHACVIRYIIVWCTSIQTHGWCSTLLTTCRGMQNLQCRSRCTTWMVLRGTRMGVKAKPGKQMATQRDSVPMPRARCESAKSPSTPRRSLAPRPAPI